MLSHASVLCLAVGLAIGFVSAGESARAELPQPEPAFFDRGDTVMLTFVRDAHSEHGVQMTCKVTDVQGQWVRCAPIDDAPVRQDQHWYSLEYVVQIQVARRDR